MDDFFGKIIKIVEKYEKAILIALVAAVFLGPVIIWLFYSVIPTFLVTDISADGMLGYWGNMFSGCVSILVAVIALYQAGLIHRLEQEKSADERKQQICPKLQVALKKKGNYFDLFIGNNAPFRAVGVYLFEYNMAPTVAENKHVKKRVVFQDSAPNGYIAIDSGYYELDDNGYPKSLVFCFTDIDNNLIEQEFRLVEGNQYEFVRNCYL